MRCHVGHTIPVPEVHLFHSRDRMAAWCEGHGIDLAHIEFLDADAQTWTWRNGTEMRVTVLLENVEGGASNAALLAHEATHIALNVLSELGEDDYGDETLAYLVEAFTKALLKAHNKWLRKRRIRPN